MSERELFRLVALHFGMGAILGIIFMTTLLIIRVHRISDLVAKSSNPMLVAAILIVGAAIYFAFGASVTGFQFVITEENNDRGQSS